MHAVVIGFDNLQLSKPTAARVRLSGPQQRYFRLLLPGEKLEKKTRYLYGMVLSVPDIHYLLLNRNIVGSKFYWLHLSRRCVVLALMRVPASMIH